MGRRQHTDLKLFPTWLHAIRAIDGSGMAKDDWGGRLRAIKTDLEVLKGVVKADGKARSDEVKAEVAAVHAAVKEHVSDVTAKLTAVQDQLKVLVDRMAVPVPAPGSNRGRLSVMSKAKDEVQRL